MKWTNRHGLPDTLVKAAMTDNYTKGDARISVTGLIQPPQIAILREKYASEIVVDVADDIWRIVGTAIHGLLERMGDETHLPEERLFADVLGWRISGGIDLQMLGPTVAAVRDYKFCAVYSVRGEKAEWVAQLNAYKYLIEISKGWEVKSLGVVALLRDWLRSRAKLDPTYPQAPVQTVNIPMWSHDEARQYIEGRIRLHREALRASEWGEDLPPCTDDERWARPGGYAVIKRGGKRARKVYQDEAEACSSAREDEEVQERPTEYIRCSGNYCNVAEWCSQFKGK